MKLTKEAIDQLQKDLADALDEYICGDERKAKAGDRIIEVVWAEGFDRIKEIRFVDPAEPGRPSKRRCQP